MDKTIIAIDGLASTGKSTSAKMLSVQLGIPYVDSGALFRGITFFALDNDWVSDGQLNEEALQKELDNIQINFDSKTNALLLNGKDISDEIRSKEVSGHVSQIAKLPYVRSFLLKLQRIMGDKHGLVMDGRDIGTAVFPNADYKFFFTARPEVRAQRRWEEMRADGQQVSYEEVLQNLLDRDNIDSKRKFAPLKMADDAIEIDTTELTLDEVLALLIKKIKSK